MAGAGVAPVFMMILLADMDLPCSAIFVRAVPRRLCRFRLRCLNKDLLPLPLFAFSLLVVAGDLAVLA